MATDRLKIYNGALLLLGERRLATLSENREPRLILDDVWQNGGVRSCLEQGQWRFAMRSVLVDYDPDVTPSFGYRRAFSKTTDWVVTCAVCSDEYYRNPVMRYQDEGGYIYADLDSLYCRHVSDDPDFGLNFAIWPESFREFVEAYFASKIIRKITSDESKLRTILGPNLDGKGGELGRARKIAKNKNAQSDPTQFQAQGTWTRSRYGSNNRGPLGDGGNPGSLTG